MKIMCIDVSAPRSDNIQGQPSAITIGVVYEVAEVLDTQYSIINDEMKMGRYSKFRFEVIDDAPVKPLRENFNSLTTCMRTRIKELEARVSHLETLMHESLW